MPAFRSKEVRRKTNEVDTISVFRQRLLAALSMLDQRGTNHRVTEAMSIVFEGFESLIANDNASTEELYKRGIMKSRLHT